MREKKEKMTVPCEPGVLFMKEALKQARLAFEKDEVPIGAVITRQNKIIARSYNQVELLKDPTAHAEMLVITMACEALQSKWLEECALYVTIEPCTMCAGALVLARIKQVVFGASDPKTGAFGSRANINSLKLNHKIEVKKGVMEEECSSIIHEFFRHRCR